jgi:hypothetical protein
LRSICSRKNNSGWRPIKREAEALSDLKRAGMEMYYVGYDR